MKPGNSLLLACLLQASFTICPAETPISIPVEIAHQMKKGKKLDLVWAAPDFDGSKGFRLGAIANETDGNVQAVQGYFPIELRRMLQADSPYTLQVTITSLQAKAPSRERPGARLELEGRLVDTNGEVHAAFMTSASSTAGLDVNDCVRLSLRAIVFAMSKDLFTSALPKGSEKSPAVMVPAVPIPAHAPGGSSAAAPLPAASPEPLMAAAVPAPVPTVAAPAMVVPPSKPAPAEAQPELPSALIPTAIAAKMQRGKGLTKVWINPDYDRASGFALGEVRYQVEARNDGVDQYLPEALAEICRADSPYTLQIRIVELQSRIQGQAGSLARLGLEGNVVAKNGSVMAAFTTLESVVGSIDLIETFRMASRKVVLAIAKELK